MFQDGTVKATLTKSPAGPSSSSPVWLINSFLGGHLTSLFPNSNFILSLAYENHPATKRLLRTAYEVLKHSKAREAKLTSYTNDYSFTTFFSTISSLLTLFSKFFSPFLRSTCSLSVSHKYLALEEVYLPFRAAIPNNPTLRKRSLVPRRGRLRGFHPLWRPVPRNLCHAQSPPNTSLDYNSLTLC